MREGRLENTFGIVKDTWHNKREKRRRSPICLEKGRYWLFGASLYNDAWKVEDRTKTQIVVKNPINAAYLMQRTLRTKE